MIRCLICDDDQAFLTITADKVSGIFQNHGISHSIDSYHDMKALMIHLKNEGIYYDLAILDLEMPVFDGIAVSKAVRSIYPNCLIIALTSHRELAVDLYEVRFFRFIPKEEICQRLEKYLLQASAVIHRFEGEALVMNENRSPVKLTYRRIKYIKNVKKYCYIYLESEKQPVKVRSSLLELESKLPDFNFFRPDKGVIINLSFVEQIKGNTLMLSDGCEFAISRNKRSSLKERITLFWGDQL